MLDYYIEWVRNLPPEIATALVAMLPIGELRGAIPFALAVYDIPFWRIFVSALVGNIIVVVLLLWLLEPVSKFLMKHSKLMKRFFTWLFERTRKKHSKSVERWEELALILFVAIPLPVTGGWTGALMAFVFGISFKKALPLIILGLIIAGVIVSALSLGVVGVANHI